MASLFLLFFLFAFHFHQNTAQQSILQTYIIHVNLPEGSHDFFPGGSPALESWYGSFLDGIQFLDTETTPSRMVYMYRNVITGFAAKLYPHEVKAMEKKEGFLHATLEEKYALHTTRSPNFSGLYQNVGAWPASNYGKGVIIGVVDSGITPGHPSFSGENVPPPPAKWKGKCELKSTVSCNNKIIGARNFARDDPGEPVDNDGHGTHVASIAAGNIVPGANISGMAPLAHLAIYKACRKQDCYSSDILAAMDAAIEDGVDILSLSFGMTKNVQIYEDNIALGAFSAMKKGIFVSCSGGNSSQLFNGAPWILTVGASRINIKADARVLLGNEDEYDAQTLFQPEDYQPSFLSIIYPGMSGDKQQSRKASLCLRGSLDDIDVAGKLVVCDVGQIDSSEKGRVVRDAGGAGMILVNEKLRGYTTFAKDQVLPAVEVNKASGQSIKSYVNSTFSPIAILLFLDTVIGDKTAPSVAYFSPRGPNLASPGNLKPDIIGPRLNILAAWPKSVDKKNNRQASFNMLSGTSLSCPHLSGVAALIKSSHPDWSPAMIKSAIMTSATQTNLNQGLVHDISTNDYISYLCNLFTEKQVAIIVGRSIECSASEYKGFPEAELNYPSLSVELSDSQISLHSRTVTNVGDANSVYDVKIEDIPNVGVTVEPKSLTFTKVGVKKTYHIAFARFSCGKTDHSHVEGSITWVSPKHSVRIPISVKLVTKGYLSSS
ncbi:subtilisin-like protease isoform X2 [Henckelia pumila]|uniref:subtilisin-like protease isoform X2 n=1 Tax=Henckelia pumila TaxID=405737 RepID=UPI003C6E2F38